MAVKILMTLMGIFMNLAVQILYEAVSPRLRVFMFA